MFKAIFLITIVLAVAYTQGEDDAFQAQQAQMSMKRTACLVLSRYHSNTQKDTIEGIITSLPPDAQQKAINKMYASAIEHCLPLISMDDTQKFFVEDPSFNPEEMFHIFEGFDYSTAAEDYDTLSKNQEGLIKFMKNFDEEMQVRREEKEAQDQDSGAEDKFQMKFLGFSFNEIPSFIKLVYFVIFMGAIGFAIMYGLKKIDDTNKPKNSPNKKKRVSPKKSQ